MFKKFLFLFPVLILAVFLNSACLIVDNDDDDDDEKIIFNNYTYETIDCYIDNSYVGTVYGNSFIDTVGNYEGIITIYCISDDNYYEWGPFSRDLNDGDTIQIDLTY